MASTHSVLVFTGMITAVLFLLIAYPLAFAYPGYDFAVDVLSELGAVDSPIMFFANILFIVFGFFLSLFGAACQRLYAKRLPGKVGALLIVLSGLSVMLVGLFPCDPACIGLTVIGNLHLTFIRLSLILVSGGVACFILEEQWGGGFRAKGQKHWRDVFITFLVLGGFFALLYFGIAPVLDIKGAIQRIAFGFPMLLFSMMSLDLFLGNSPKKHRQRSRRTRSRC